MVALPINQQQVKHKEFIPKDIPFEDNKKLVEQAAMLINKQIPVLLIGETGTGKTSLVRHLANKTNNGFVRVNHNGGTSVEDILGRWLIDNNGKTVWADGILIQAMKEGYWFLGDEINAAPAEINFVYHSLLDDDGRVVLAEKGNEVVIPHPNFRFFGAMNPPTEYAGTKELNKALMSRFGVLKVDFPAPKVEAQIVSERTGVSNAVATRMVKMATEVRINHGKGEYRFVMSTRDLIMWAQMYKEFDKFIVSAEATVLNKIGEDDIEAIKTSMGLHFNAIDKGDVSVEDDEGWVSSKPKPADEDKPF